MHCSEYKSPKVCIFDFQSLFQILSVILLCMIETCFTRTISPLENSGNERRLDVKATSLVANDEETKTLLAWLNMINTKAALTHLDNRNRGRALPSTADNAYVKKDGFLVAKAPSNVPSLLRKCKGFAFKFVNTVFGIH